jgi:hypothetical protein
MGRRQLLALVFVSGYIVALAPVLWARYDVGRIPRSIWRYTAPRPRELWRGSLLFGYMCGGWPGIVIVLAWRFGQDRAALREEWAYLHRRNLDVHEPKPRDDEREIVLADYEDAPDAPERADAPDAPDAERHQDAPPASG